MLLEMGLIVGGIPTGWALRKQRVAMTAVGFILTWAVRVLLFLLGLSLGADAILMAGISELGLQAAIISTFSVGGCLVVAWLMGRFFQLENRGESAPSAPVGTSGSVTVSASVPTVSLTSGLTSAPEALSASSPSSVSASVSGHASAPVFVEPSAPPSGGLPMKGSLLVLGFFFAGVLAGRMNWLPHSLAASDASLWTLYILLFSAGMGVGFDLKALGIIRELKGRILLVPLGVVAGTLTGSTVGWGVLHLLLPGGMALPEAMAVGAGFGYYSLATVIMTQMGNAALGSVALLSNMIHELIALTLSPLIVRLVGRLGPVMAGGAAAMDTCLPIIARASGERYAIVAVFSGIALTLLVPVLVPALMALR